MTIRSRRQTHASATNNGPIVFNLDKFNYKAFVNLRRHRSLARAFLVVINFAVVFVCLMIHLYPEKVKSTASVTWSALFAARCNCTLSVISLLRDGKAHPCKDYCSGQLEWTLAPKPWFTPNKRYGSFAVFGNCKKEEVLSLKNSSTPLIPRSSASHLPEFQSLIETKFRNVEILLLGGTILEQVFDVLPSVLNSETITLTDEHFSYNSSSGGEIQPIKQCFTDLKTKTQKCWRNEKVRASCTCSKVTTLQLETSNTTARFLGGFGIEFDHYGTQQTYGSSYNVVKEPLYAKLAQTASAVIFDVDVLAHETTHNTQLFANFLSFIQQFAMSQKVVYGLAMPQHYSTIHPTLSTFNDEPLKHRSSCVATAPQRHWTDAMAQAAFNSGGLDMIDLFPITATQGHMHSHKQGDCSSWCLAYDVFYVFWATLADAIHSTAEGVGPASIATITETHPDGDT